MLSVNPDSLKMTGQQTGKTFWVKIGEIGDTQDRKGKEAASV